MEQRSTFLGGVLPCLSFGDGPPLVVMVGLTPAHAAPRGPQRTALVRLFAPLARDRTIHLVDRRPQLPLGSTMADIAADHATAFAAEFGTDAPVDVLGISTGGSIAQQLALDHPASVRRLVLVNTAHQLPAGTRVAMARCAQRLGLGDHRGAAAAMAPLFAAGPIALRATATMLWISGALRAAVPAGDMVAMIRAEDDFAVRGRLGELTAPTLVIGGTADHCYPAASVQETAAAIPRATLALYPGRNHRTTMIDRQFVPDIRRFLSAPDGT